MEAIEMTELSVTLSELAAKCKTLGAQANRKEDNEVRARNVQSQLDTLTSETDLFSKNIVIRKHFEEHFPETAHSEFMALPIFKPTPRDVAVDIAIFEDFDDSNAFSDLQEKVEAINTELRDFRISSRTRDIWDNHRDANLHKIFQEITQVESLKPDEVGRLKTEIKTFASSGKLLNGENVKKLKDLILESDALRENLEQLPEKVKKFLNLLAPDQPGAPIKALDNSDVSEWIEENNFKPNLVIRMKDS